MKNLLKMTAISLIALSSIATTTVKADETKATNYEEKLPYMFKEPNWEKYHNGDTGVWPLPKAPPYSTGLFSTSTHNSIDYKEDKNEFFKNAAKYKSSGNLEVYYESNPSTSITTAENTGGTLTTSVGGDTILTHDLPDTEFSAFNNAKGTQELILDTAQGQWLVTNGIYSRDNAGQGVRRTISTGGAALHITPLVPNPWGTKNTNNNISPEDFLVGLAKSVYGVQQSRPVYFQTAPKRLAKKLTWEVTNPPRRQGCGNITWTVRTTDWDTRDVSLIDQSHKSLTAPGCGETKIIDRGEYIVHPEGYLNNVYYRYHPDQNSFISANVYEMYFLKLLQKGILTVDNTFALVPKRQDFTPDENNSDNFTLATKFGEQFYIEYKTYGRVSSEGNGKQQYPAWAKELGSLYSNPELKNKEYGSNLTDKSIDIRTFNGQKPHENALGFKYKVNGSSDLGTTSIVLGDYKNKIMTKDSVVIMNALRMIEKAMRVEYGDMTKTEAAIITKKYNAQYLQDLSDKDRQTVSYLLAKGVLNFENYQEYSNLYSTLTEGFAYKLLYRIANEEARMKFSEITLTDSEDIPANFAEFRENFFQVDLANLTSLGLLNNRGDLIKEDGEDLNLLSDVDFLASYGSDSGTEVIKAKIQKRYYISVTLDDVLKYTYKGLPLVNVDSSGKAIYKKDNILEVFNDSISKGKPVDTGKGLANDINKELGRYVGINKILYDKHLARYSVEFYVYGEDYKTALKFVKANLETRISNVTDKKEEVAVTTENGSVYSEQTPKEMGSSTSQNNDLVVNTDYDGLYGVSNANGSISGNTITPGVIVGRVGQKVMSSLNHVIGMNSKATRETIGKGGLVIFSADQLKGSTTVVKNTEGKTVGRTNMITKTITSSPTTLGKQDVATEFSGYNIALLKSADNLIQHRTFSYTDREGNPAEISGSVVLSWQLDLPSEKEQKSLVGLDVTPYINDNAKSSWIFTKPTNKALAEVWNYNVGLNNAILKTVTGNNLNIPSGYFTPQIDLLLDSVSTQTINSNMITTKDLTQSQIQEIKNNYAAEISANMSANWVNNYIGSVPLANHVVNGRDSEIKGYVDTKQTDGGHTFVKPSGLMKGQRVPRGETVWAYLAFNASSKLTDTTATYFDKHSNEATFNIHTIYSSTEGHKNYGYYTTEGGDGELKALNISYVRDNFNNLFKDVNISNYSYNKETRVLRESPNASKINTVGRTVKYKDQDWFVAKSEPYSFSLYSKTFLRGIMQDGEIKLSTSGAVYKPTIMNSIHQLNLATFGKDQEKGIKSSMYLKTYGFDFTPSYDIVGAEQKFVGIKNGEMKPYIYKPIINPENVNDVKYKLEETTLNEGEIIHVPQFVVVSKSVWSITGEDLYWSKKFAGADPELYTPGSLVQSMKEQLIRKDSPNIVMSEDIKEGTLTVASIKGIIEGSQVTFTVPYKTEMILDNKLNAEAVLAEFNNNAELTLTGDGQTASATQYIEAKEVGAYNPNYDLYHNTLVVIKGILKIANGNTLTDYTETSVVDSVSLVGSFKEGIKFLNSGELASMGIYKIYQLQDTKPPAVISPFTNGALPLLNADSIIEPTEMVQHEGLPTALYFFDSLQKQLRDIAAANVWYLTVIVIIGILVLISILVLIAHVFIISPISHTLFVRLYEIVGIDFLAWMSLNTVSLEGENSWIKTVKVSVLLGILPLIVFGLFKVAGLI